MDWENVLSHANKRYLSINIVLPGINFLRIPGLAGFHPAHDVLKPLSQKQTQPEELLRIFGFIPAAVAQPDMQRRAA